MSRLSFSSSLLYTEMYNTQGGSCWTEQSLSKRDESTWSNMLGPQKEKQFFTKTECALNIHRNSLGSENALLLKGTSREVDAVLPI